MFRVFPVIPLLSLIAIIGGGITLAWYRRLTQEEKESADKYAAELAWRLFRKCLDDLTKDQAELVERLSRSHFSTN